MKRHSNELKTKSFSFRFSTLHNKTIRNYKGYPIYGHNRGSKLKLTLANLVTRGIDMAHTYKIEKAVLSDVKGIISLRVELLKEVNEIKTQEEEKTVMEATESYLKEAMEKGEFVSFVAKNGEEIVSVSGLSFFTRPPYLENLKGEEAYLLNMYTLPSHRKQGLARRILQECMKECQKREVKRVWLHASQAGEALYKSVGFQFKGSEMELFLDESEGMINK